MCDMRASLLTFFLFSPVDLVVCRAAALSVSTIPPTYETVVEL